MGNEERLATLRQAWENSGDGEAGYTLAEALERSGALDEARLVYEALRDTGSALGYYGLAWLERAGGNFDAADMLLTHAVKMLGDDPVDGSLFAGILGVWRWRHLGRTDVEALLRRGANSFPEARATLGILLRETGRVREAETVLREGVAHGELWSYLPLATICEATGRFDEAEHLLEQGYLSGDAHSAYNLYVSLRAQERYAEATWWLELAALGGDDVAIRRLMKRDA